MTKPLTVEAEFHFERHGRGGRRLLEPGIIPHTDRPVGRLPRITRLMALAIRIDNLIQNGEFYDYAEVARAGRITRARVTQIMNLLMLAPDIQEEILFLQRVTEGNDPIHLRQLQSIALVPDWGKQRRMWRNLDTSNGFLINKKPHLVF